MPHRQCTLSLPMAARFQVVKQPVLLKRLEVRLVPSELSARLTVLVSPLEAGSFTVEGLSPASILRFPTRAALDQGQVTSAPVLAPPAVNSFDAGTAFAIRVQLQYTGDGTPVTNRPFATVTFSK